MNTVTNLNIIPLQPVDIFLHIRITSLYATSISLTNMYFLQTATRIRTLNALCGTATPQQRDEED